MRQMRFVHLKGTFIKADSSHNREESPERKRKEELGGDQMSELLPSPQYSTGHNAATLSYFKFAAHFQGIDFR